MDLAYDFLDDGRVHYTTYRKKLCLYMFTPYVSCHPKSIFKAIVSTEVHRLIITNSTQTAFSQQVAFIIGKFRAMGYPPSVLHEAVDKKQWQDRPMLLDRLRRLRQQRGSRNPGLQGAIPFKLRFAPELPAHFAPIFSEWCGAHVPSMRFVQCHISNLNLFRRRYSRFSGV